MSSPKPRTAALAVVALSLLCGACANWPTANGGGGAELVWADPLSNSENLQVASLARRAEACSQALAQLHDQGAYAVAPAALVTSEKRLIRSDREIAAGLLHDADLSLDEVAMTLNRVAGTVGGEISPYCLA